MATITSVKWATPEEELIGTAQAAQRSFAAGNEVCLLTPNRNWALQARKACRAIGAPAVLLAPMGASPATRARMQALATAAHNETHEARGFSLVHALGLDQDESFECALLHICGTEDASELAEIITHQASRPSLPAGCARIAIRIWGQDEYTADDLFAVACIEGLYPSRENEAARIASKARRQCVFSRFREMDRLLAIACDAQGGRDLTRNGKALRSTEAWKELSRITPAPSTFGGQAFLRELDLN